MIEHIARRGLAPANMALFKRSSEDLEMPVWGTVLLVATFVAAIVVTCAVEYTLKDLLPALAMVETPAAVITVSHAEDDTDKGEKEGLLESGPTITLVHQKPMTSSIRGTIRHLVSEGGRAARWRGFQYKAIHSFAFSWVISLISMTAIIPHMGLFSRTLISAAAGAATANLHAAWTHKMISAPSAMHWWARVPSRSSWKVLAGPAAISAAMPYVSLYISMGFFELFGLQREINRGEFDTYNGGQFASFFGRFAAVIVIAVSCTLFLCLPAMVTQVRVEASLLPEEEDTIVPFDRTFGGKVVSKVLGGTGSVGFFDAWRSFNWEARRRLMKLYVKGFFAIMALFFVVAHVFVFELFIILGPKLGKVLAEAEKQGFMQ